MKSRIGIFGGAFNPIHFGHLFIAKEAKEVFSLDKVIFVPTGNPVFKKNDLLDKNIRFSLVRKAIAMENNFEVSDYEVRKLAKSYSIDTLYYFKQVYQNAELFEIIGEDAFLQFHRWKKPFDILENSEIIIAKRFEGNFVSVKKYINEYFNNYSFKLHLLEHPLYSVSSTIIRERIQQGKFVSYLLPEVIEREIIENGYYRQNQK